MATSRTETSTYLIKVNGAALPPERTGMIVDVTVEQDLGLPATFAIRMRDLRDVMPLSQQTYYSLLDSDQFPIGGAIEIAMGDEQRPQTILKAEITALELDLAPTGVPLIIVRGYDRLYRLHRVRRSQTFINVSDADIVGQIASAHGLRVQAEPTTRIYEHVFQHNQTDLEFLRARASRIGFELFIDDTTLVFRKPQALGTPPVHEFGQSLHRVRVRLSAPAQVSKVTVKGWNPKEKREVVGTATRAASRHTIGEQKTGAQLAAPFGGGEIEFFDPEAVTQAEATARAEAIYDEVASDLLHMEGVCAGDARLVPGRQIELRGIGRRFSGRYYLTATTHRWTHDEGYVTHFTAGGRRPHVLAALLSADAAGAVATTSLPGHYGVRAGGPGAFPGVVTGIVTNVRPDNARQGGASPLEGQVKVRFPWLSNSLETAWARLAMPMAGNDRGFYWLPEMIDEVLVAFEQGDINRPYVIGSIWNGKDVPPARAADIVGPQGSVDRRIIKSRTGHTITLDDSQNNAGIIIRSRSGHTITLDDSQGQPSIAIIDQTGHNTIKLESSTNTLKIAVDGDMVLEARQNVTLKGANVNVEATAGKLDAKAQQELALKGTTTNVEATATLTVKAGARGTIDGGPMLEVKGGLLKLN